MYQYNLIYQSFNCKQFNSSTELGIIEYSHELHRGDVIVLNK
jgi:hypothetical protein